MEDLAVELFKINAIKFGDYKTKVGLHTPVYFDLRVIVSFPSLMVSILETEDNLTRILTKRDKIK